MGVTKKILQEGHGPIPQKGDKVTIEYTGFLKDLSKPDLKGEKWASPSNILDLSVLTDSRVGSTPPLDVVHLSQRLA